MDDTTRAMLAEMSGETKTSPRLELNEIMLNGKTGEYYLIEKKKGLVEVDGKKKFDRVELGKNIKVVFLRIRRKLRQFRKGDKPLTTNEHNTKYDKLTLFGGDTIVKGTNDDLRERFPNLKTNQIVYCILNRKEGSEVCRLIVRGASLGSQNKAKDVHDFYSYISSFKSGGADDHFYEHITELSSVEETSDMGGYYCMTYNRGNKLSDDQLATVVLPQMKIVHEFIKKSDEYYQTKTPDEIKKEVEPELDTIEYPADDDINPEDIPF